MADQCLESEGHVTRHAQRHGKYFTYRYFSAGVDPVNEKCILQLGPSSVANLDSSGKSGVLGIDLYEGWKQMPNSKRRCVNLFVSSIRSNKLSFIFTRCRCLMENDV